MNRILIIATLLAGSAFAADAPLSYPIVGTGQTKCYDNHREIEPPKPGQPFYGQDAQIAGHAPSYTLGTDGLTVCDNVTGLTWQRSPDTDSDGVLTRRDKLTLAQAQELPAKLNAARLGGFDDWRLPSIKELYSLFDGRGTDPSGPMNADTAHLTPYLDTNYFKFAYGDATGERVIDSQYASSTKYVGKSARGFGKLFGVNFADGRIKGYDLQMPGGGVGKTFFVICVRGNPAYGHNDLHDNGDGSITDRATGLTWSRTDSGQGLNWQDALAWVQKQNGEKFLGHDDWRLPSGKELQSIVDYTRSPDTSQSPAIEHVFNCTTLTNEAGQADFAFYWSATTHSGFQGGGAAMYVAFGRAAGWMSPRSLAGGPPERRSGPGDTSAGEYRYVDVHGAGAQRSDPKAGDPAMFPHGRGPQGDVIHINNFVRLVRGGDVKPRPEGSVYVPSARASVERQFPAEGGSRPGMGGMMMMLPPINAALDADGDGVIGADEIAKATESLKKLDKNGDGKLSAAELMPPPPGGTNQFGFRPPPDGKHPVPPIIAALDTNGDGELDATEIANVSASLLQLDVNGDGKLSRE